VTARALRVASAAGVIALPVVAALYVGATTFGGTFIPWQPTMVDLDVYRRAGQTLLEGGDIYHLPGQLPFLYPPLAALLAVPLALLPRESAEIGWTIASALALLAVVRRCGLRGWLLSIVTAGIAFLVPSVSQSLAFGQLGIFLVALVFLDLAPGDRALGTRRLMPEGVLTAIATAIKLTPALFVIYLLLVRKWRAALVSTATGIVVTVLAWVIAPAASIDFWGRLAHGDTGLGHSIIYYTNQSIMADVVRMFGFGTRPAVVGLALSAVVAVLGVLASARWHRLGHVSLAVVLCGVAGLLASPVSWLHHFVWIVPLGLYLLDLRPPVVTAAGLVPRRPAEPAVWVRVLGLVFVGWVVVAPFRRLPNGADVELSWTWSQHLLAATTALLGTAFLLATLLVTPVRAAATPAPVAGPAPAPATGEAPARS
jgi:alpha-1,2-mannosyltransferase